MSAVLIVGTEGPLGERLAARYRHLGHEVTALPVDPARDLEAVVRQLGDRPLDLLVFADSYHPPDASPEALTREALRAGLHRLTFIPFRLAGLLHDALAATQGKIVLLSRREGTVAPMDEAGRYLERPFRAAAHALLRCLAVEWKDAGIHVALVVVDDATDIASLPDVIARAPNGVLVDAENREIAW